MKKIYLVIDYLNEYVIWHLISSKWDYLGRYLPSPYPPPLLRLNSIISTSARLFSQIVCRSASIFHYFETLHGPLESIITMFQIHKIDLTVPTVSRKLFWFIFCLFLYIVTFLKFLYFLRTSQLLHFIFSQMFLVLLRRLPT